MNIINLRQRIEDNLKKRNIRLVGFCFFVLLYCGTFTSLSQAEIESVTIRGDQESPTVLYLVPWKKIPAAKNNSDLELNLDYEFLPLSRSEVIRQIRYFKQLKYKKKKDKKRTSKKRIR